MTKKDFLINIEKYCDIDSVEEIENIYFWYWEFWIDADIRYRNWNTESYDLALL